MSKATLVAARTVSQQYSYMHIPIMENKDLAPCLACGSSRKRIYYQRRAADEPPDEVIYCPNCPLDTARLKLNSVNKLPEQISDTGIVNISRENIKKKRISTSASILTKISTKAVIKVEGSAAMRCYKNICRDNLQSLPITEIRIPAQIGDRKEVCSFHINSTTKNQAWTVSSSYKIAPYITFQNIDVLTQKSPIPTFFTEVISGYEYLLEPMEHSSTVILRTLYEGKQPHILVIMDKSNPKDDIVLSVLQQILIRYGTENTIKSFVNSTIISSLYTQSGRAYDWPSAPSSGYMYAWKPDGERFWYIRYGSVWLFSRRLLSGRISGWNIANSLQQATKPGLTLDIEVMIGYDPILIDILVNERGVITPALRSLDYVLSEFSKLRNLDVPIHVRKYYKTEQEVLDTKDSLGYPVDGVVGVQDNSMTIIKLKDTKSIELSLLPNGDLVSSDNKLVCSSNLQDTYDPGSIIEVRFTKQSSLDKPSIIETLLRTDKIKANEYSVCEDIINTMSDMPDTLARRKALTWCNAIRQKLHQISASTIGRGRVILDIGSGDGQAVSDYVANPEVTYILVEPNLAKCKKLAKRIGESARCKLFEGSTNIVKIVGLVSTGSLKYAIVCDTLESLLKQNQVISVLKSCVRYCLASFSISYTSTALCELALSGIDIVGCGYMYDSVDNSGTLIDEYGVKMVKLDNKSAKVTWGSDKEYYEPLITTTDFKEVFHIRLATDLLPVLGDNDCSLLTTISSKVFIISTRKHI